MNTPCGNPLRYRGYVYDTETGFYYLQSRYYDPQFGRFINADVLVSTGQGLLGNNMFAYCRNNSVNSKDAFGTYDLCALTDEEDINPFNDLVGAKGGGGGGTGIHSSYYAQQNVRAYDSGWRNSCYNMPSSGWKCSASQTDFYVTPEGEVIPANLDGFYSNLSKLENVNGKFVGNDSHGPIRIRINEIHDPNPNYTGIQNPYHTIPHFHIDRRVNVVTGPWVSTYVGAMEMLR